MKEKEYPHQVHEWKSAGDGHEYLSFTEEHLAYLKAEESKPWPIEWDWPLIMFGGIGLFMLLWLLGVI